MAEEVVLGNKSTGAGNDYQQAVKIAKTIISTGLSTLGILSFENIPSEMLNNEIKNIISEEELIVQELIKNNSQVLLRIAEILKEYEKIDGDKIREILAA